MRRFRPDPYIVALLTVVAFASVLPARGSVSDALDQLVVVAIGFLFFLYGARLSTETVVAGVKHWRLHLLVLIATFVLFPLLGLAIQTLPSNVLNDQLSNGVLFLCLLPSTVQSSIAFTSIAKGNIAAAICTASLSNVLGVLLTPFLVALLLSGANGARLSVGTIVRIVLQLLLPFALGQLARPWIGEWVARHKKVLGLLDRGSILLVVYTAFSGAVVAGVWHVLSARDLAVLVLVCAALLAAALGTTTLTARRLGFSREDRITIIFCGSKKSLATGAPMASVLFAGTGAGLVILPLMLFHQLQLIVCALLARRWAAASTSNNALTDAESAESAATASVVPGGPAPGALI